MVYLRLKLPQSIGPNFKQITYLNVVSCNRKETAGIRTHDRLIGGLETLTFFKSKWIDNNLLSSVSFILSRPKKLFSWNRFRTLTITITIDFLSLFLSFTLSVSQTHKHTRTQLHYISFSRSHHFYLSISSNSSYTNIPTFSYSLLHTHTRAQTPIFWWWACQEYFISKLEWKKFSRKWLPKITACRKTVSKQTF